MFTKNMKKWCLAGAAALMLISLAAPAGAKSDKPVVAVMYFETVNCKPYLSEVVALYLMTALAYLGQYEVAKPELVAKIMEGAEIKPGGAVSAEEAISMAKKIGASVVCRGKVTAAGDSYTVTVDSFNAVTGQPIKSRSASVTGEVNLSKAIDKIVGLSE